MVLKLQMINKYYITDWIKQMRPKLNVCDMSMTAMYHIQYMDEHNLIDDDVFITDVGPDGTLCCMYVNRPGGCILTPQMMTEYDINISQIRPREMFEHQ